MKLTITRVVLLALLALQAPAHAQEANAFQIWLDALRAEAVSKGFSAESIELAFSEIREPVQRIVTNDRNQAETVQTYADYLNARVSEWKQTNGLRLMTEHRELLDAIAQEYGVQARFIVAIWGMETNFGTYPLPESAFSALATLAYDKRRADFYRAQFFDALKILDSGFPGYEKMKASWAGALGQSQFLPENYLRFAVDFDKDGHKDIWDTEADVFASIANYIASFKWNPNQTWGRKVSLPANNEQNLASTQGGTATPDQRCQRYKSLGTWRNLQQWQTLGVRNADGSDLPTASFPAALIPADDGDGQGYLVYGNFCSIMRFNPAFKYALSIGLLSDLIDLP